MGFGHQKPINTFRFSIVMGRAHPATADYAFPRGAWERVICHLFIRILIPLRLVLKSAVHPEVLFRVFLDLVFEELVDLRRCRGFIHIPQVAHFGENLDVPLAGAGSEAEPGDDFDAFLGEVLGAGGGGGGAAKKLSEFDFAN